jgi:hypothetical protein
MQTIHNPDRYMTDLRQIMSQGRKRIGLFIGAGAPTSIRVDCNGKINPAGSALIPDVAGLTNYVVQKLVEGDRSVVEGIRETRQKRKKVAGIQRPIRDKQPLFAWLRIDAKDLGNVSKGARILSVNIKHEHPRARILGLALRRSRNRSQQASNGG